MKIRLIVLTLVLLTAFTAFCYGEGQIQGLKEFEHWDNGKMKKCIMYDAAGKMKAKAYCRYDGTLEKVEKFDNHGNKIEEALFDQKGKLKSGIDGWAAMRWWYENGRLLSQISYDEQGKPIERLMYSDSGQLVQRLYSEDKPLNPYEEANMFILLGAQNIGYRDPHPRDDEDRIFEK